MSFHVPPPEPPPPPRRHTPPPPQAPTYPGPFAGPPARDGPVVPRGRLYVVLGVIAAVAVAFVAGIVLVDPEPSKAELIQDLAVALREDCSTVTAGPERLAVTVPADEPDCSVALGGVLRSWDFGPTDLDRALGGQKVERGKFTLEAAPLGDGILVGIEVD